MYLCIKKRLGCAFSDLFYISSYSKVRYIAGSVRIVCVSNDFKCCEHVKLVKEPLSKMANCEIALIFQPGGCQFNARVG